MFLLESLIKIKRRKKMEIICACGKTKKIVSLVKIQERVVNVEKNKHC